MEQIICILTDLIPDVDFAAEQQLIDHGILDSLTLLQVVDELSEAFDVEFSPLDMSPENFQSAAAMDALIRRLQE